MKSKLASFGHYVTGWRRQFRTRGDMTSLPQHVIAPYLTPWKGGPSAEGLPDYGRIRHGDRFVDEISQPVPDKCRELKGRYLYGGPFMNHFGVVMVYSIARCWAFDAKKHRAIVFSYCPKKVMKELPAWARSIYSYLGVDPARIIIARNPVKVDHLDVAEPGSEFFNGPSSWYLDYLKHRQVNTGYKLAEKLYFGRTHIIRQGTLMGESYFSQLILNSGFTYIKPEDYSLADQLSVLQNCRQAIFSEGSALYLYELLHSTDTKCFMLPRRTKSSILFEPYVKPRADFHRLGGSTVIERLPEVNGVVSPKSASYCMNPRAIFEDLQTQQLIFSSFDFDFQKYEQCEREDALEYFGEENLQFAESQLLDVKARREKYLRSL
ncbi:MAG: glycosyltransferase family 61 protein [Deltaproteobacteria bacterium]|nr:glycosyltransferase family 61 protein [Deltaproteobacteria bacterium]